MFCALARAVSAMCVDSDGVVNSAHGYVILWGLLLGAPGYLKVVESHVARALALWSSVQWRRWIAATNRRDTPRQRTQRWTRVVKLVNIFGRTLRHPHSFTSAFTLSPLSFRVLLIGHAGVSVIQCLRTRNDLFGMF